MEQKQGFDFAWNGYRWQRIPNEAYTETYND